jgi:PhoH-like ATPase
MPRKKEKKLFVLDTSVILFDHNAVGNFAEHDVAIPITVLEEVDRFKKGNDVINYEAREFIRLLDQMSSANLLQDWLPIAGGAKGMFKVQMNEKSDPDTNVIFGERKADHNILNATIRLMQEMRSHKVILVTKDINLRLKARSLSIHSEDYETGKVKDIQKLYRGYSTLENVPQAGLNKLFASGTCTAKDLRIKEPIANHYYVLRRAEHIAYAYFNGDSGFMERVNREIAYGIKPRNTEQAFALHAVMNPNVLLVKHCLPWQVQWLKNNSSIRFTWPDPLCLSVIKILDSSRAISKRKSIPIWSRFGITLN